MSLERFANELLLDVFEYLPAVHLLRAFHQLNTRFNDLIVTHFRKYRFDFQTASKQDFDIICQINLPLITDQIVSLGLSDADETPQQIHLFRSAGWTLNRFPNLRSLSFDHLRSSEIISEILLECPQLIHLSLNGCYFGCRQSEFLHFINTIWSLSKLRYCYLNMDFKQGLTISIPTKYSLSIEHLSIIGVTFPVGQVNNLCEHTPHLRYLALDLTGLPNDKGVHTMIPSIKEVNFVFVGVQHEMIENLLQYIPNLCQLKIETCYVDIDGYEWERIIRNYLPKLKVFQMKMRCQILREKDRQDLLKSFQTPFWLKEHQWFIRYHYNPDDKSNMICLYTLPYNFSNLDIHFPVLYKSTCSNEEDYSSYEYVQHLIYRSSAKEGMTISDLKFPNINSLSITLPINDHLLSFVQKLDRLNLLKVSRPNDMPNTTAHAQLQTVLDHIPNLSTLKFSSWPHTTLERCQPFINSSIRQLNFLGYNHWFSEEDCIELSRSSLAIRCEILYIKVRKQTDILYLINTMRNLRAVVVRLFGDDSISYLSQKEHQFDYWLQHNLPSGCSIKRDSRYVHHIRIWIDF